LNETSTVAQQHDSSITKIDTSTQRLSEEIKAYIAHIQTDMLHTNELKINEVVGRLA
jgi:hypothetical protein